MPTKQHRTERESSAGEPPAGDTARAQVADQLQTVLAKHPRVRASLIPLLQDVQVASGYLPSKALESVAHYLRLPLSAVYGVTTFYTQFHLTRQGKHRIKVCQGTACHVRGSTSIIEAVKKRIGIGPGETSEGFEFSVESVACFGSCALAPVMVVNDRVYGNMTPERASEILEGLD